MWGLSRVMLCIPLGKILYLAIHQFPLCGQAMRSSGSPCFRQERWTPELRSPQVRLEKSGPVQGPQALQGYRKLRYFSGQNSIIIIIIFHFTHAAYKAMA